MRDKAFTIYRTTGCVEPAPYGLFDDEYRFTASNGDRFHLLSEETNHLLSAIHSFQWNRKLIPLPELPIVTEWNMLKGPFDADARTATLSDLPRLIDALQVLRENYADYESDGKQHGYAALSTVDLDALIAFLVNALSRNETVTLAEH